MRVPVRGKVSSLHLFAGDLLLVSVRRTTELRQSSRPSHSHSTVLVSARVSLCSVLFKHGSVIVRSVPERPTHRSKSSRTAVVVFLHCCLLICRNPFFPLTPRGRLGSAVPQSRSPACYRACRQGRPAHRVLPVHVRPRSVNARTRRPGD